jgi:hypothetical protein
LKNQNKVTEFRCLNLCQRNIGRNKSLLTTFWTATKSWLVEILVNDILEGDKIRFRLIAGKVCKPRRDDLKSTPGAGKNRTPTSPCRLHFGQAC